MTPRINKTVFAYARKIICIAVLIAFMTTSVMPVYAQTASESILQLPAPGAMVHLSSEFTPAHLKGIVIHPQNALEFDFIIYKGDQVLSEEEKKIEYAKLIKYFFASLAVPDDHQWVNLSPYEKNRIIQDDFGKTEMGRDLLAQDYLLKQITASLIYPQDKLGQEFWNNVYAKAHQQFGTTDIPINTFNKVWIVPDNAEVFVKGNMAYVVKNHLKVMLEEDYLSLDKHNGIGEVGGPVDQNKAHTLGSQVVREIVLPALEKEVNEGKNFAPLRQVFSGVVLAAWYKKELKESFLGKVYMNKSRVQGVDQDPKNNQMIYEQYLKAFKKGVFNFIKDDVDKYSNDKPIARKYFSGGVVTSLGRNLHAAPPSSKQLADAAMLTPKTDIVTVRGEAMGLPIPLGEVPPVFQFSPTSALTDTKEVVQRKVSVRNPDAEFSSATRQDLISEIRSHGEVYDVFVAGGGIAGTSVARDSVSRNLSTLIVEQGDWASGTSGSSTKMIHGGLRYLHSSFKNLIAMWESLKKWDWRGVFYNIGEAWINFRATQQAIKEQAIVVKNSRPITKLQPVSFIVSPQDTRAPFLYAGALIFYALSLMNGVKSPFPRFYKGKRMQKKFPQLNPKEALGVVVFDVFATDDSLLTLYTAKSAYQAGADTLNYVQVRNMEQDPSGYYVITLRDTIRNESFQVRAKTFVNASGPFIDELHRAIKPKEEAKPKPLVRLVAGAHFVVPAIGSLKESLIITVPSTTPNVRKQLMVVHRQEGDQSYFLVDTRDWESGIVVDEAVVRQEIQYMIDFLNNMFPDAKLTQDSIIRTDWGLKPLAAFDTADPDKIPREYKVLEDDHYFALTAVTITGGRKAAQGAVDQIAKKFFPDAGKSRTAKNALEIPEKPYDKDLEYMLRNEMVVRLPDLVLRRNGIKFFMDLDRQRRSQRQSSMVAFEEGWRQSIAHTVGNHLGWNGLGTRVIEESILLRSGMSMDVESRKPDTRQYTPLFDGYASDYKFFVINIPAANPDAEMAIAERVQQAFIKLLTENRILFSDYNARVFAIDKLENGFIKFSLKDFDGKPKALLLFRIFDRDPSLVESTVSLGISVFTSDIVEGISSESLLSLSEDSKKIVSVAVAEVKKLVDQSMVNAQENALTPGGIDVNAAHLNLKISHDGSEVSLPSLEQDMVGFSNITGLNPVIVKIQSAVSSPIFFADTTKK